MSSQNFILIFKTFNSFDVTDLDVLREGYFDAKDRIDSLNRLYLNGLIEMHPNKPMYPDANETMRLAYGTVEEYMPRDGMFCKYYATLKGVIEKDDPDDNRFTVPLKLISLYETGDFKEYAHNDGTMRTAFISNTHTTEGFEGGPVIDKNGFLLGVNLDRTWEGMVTDRFYSEKKCRNIVLDIRYVLFLLDKFGDAGYLLNELDLVR